MITYENLKKVNLPFEDKFKERFIDFLNHGWYILGKEVLDLKPGSEVIVPANTHIATILAIQNCNLIPVLVEPDITNYNIDPQKVKEAISPKTAALIIVHLYGQCCRMDLIMDIVKEHTLYVGLLINLVFLFLKKYMQLHSVCHVYFPIQKKKFIKLLSY